MQARVLTCIVLLVVSAASGAAPATDPGDTELPVATGLDTVRVRDGWELAPSISGIVAVAPDTLLVLESNPARVVRLVPGAPPAIVIGAGPGPSEISTERALLSRPIPRRTRTGGLPVFVHALDDLSTRVLEPDGTIRRVDHDRVVTSVVQRDSEVVAALFTPLTTGSLRREDPRFGVFDRIPAEGGSPEFWAFRDGFGVFDRHGDVSLDVARRYFTRLLPRDASTFYWLETVGAPTVHVLGPNRERIDTFTIPRGGFTPGSDERVSGVRAHLVARDALVDGAGRLHVLRGIYTADDGTPEQGREILVFDDTGHVRARYRVGFQLTCFDLVDAGPTYVAVRAGTMDVLRLEPRESDR